MKTTFRRVFLPAAAILLVAATVVGFSFRLLARNYMRDWAIDNLQQEAYAIAKISTAYFAEDQITSREFYMTLQACTESTQAEAVICDGRGMLVLCSDSPQGCDHIGLVVNKEVLTRVRNQGYYETVGMVQGLYEEQRYVVAVPIKDNAGNVIGLVMVSAPTTYTRSMLQEMTRIYLVVSVLVLVMSVLVTAYSARLISRPLRAMAKAASDFGRGRLDSRVTVDQRSPEEVRELASSFNNMAASLQRSELQRQEFVSNVSHELKTPMTTIGGYVDGILDGTVPPEKQEEYLRRVSGETKRLSRLVRSMLEMSRIQRYREIPDAQKTRFDACECVGRVLVGFEQKIVGKKINVAVGMPEEPVYTFANEDGIIQVLYNLVDNAVKFCPEGGGLGLSVTTMEKKILVTVENEGPTIPAEELDRLFDRFHKTDKSRSMDRDGWGLGLAIAKSIMASHNEDIRVRSADGKTAFTITLPLVN